MVSEYLGARTTASNRPVKYRVVITRVNAAHFRAQIRSEQDPAGGERVVDGTDCTGVAEAAALIVSMTLDPLGSTTNIHKTSELGRARAQAVSHWSLGASIGTDLGSLPEPSLGAGIVLAHQTGRVYASVSATAWLAQSVVRNATVGGGHIDLFSAVLRGCWSALRSADNGVELAPCLALELGTSTGRGVGVLDPVTRAGFWANPLVGLSLRQRSSRGLQASLALEAGIPVFRPNFAIYQGGDLFHASVVVVRATIGIAWVFF
jgi:hypothetical protein